MGKKIRSDIRYESMQIVFVSAKDNYAMQLFDIRPMNFLVKPVKYERVAYILEEYGRLFQFQPCFLELGKGKHQCKIEERSILYIQSRAKKVCVVTKDGEKEFYGKLSDIIPQLNQNAFCVVHKSYVVNLQYVAEYGKDMIRMVDGTCISVSRAMRSNLNHAIMRNAE